MPFDIRHLAALVASDSVTMWFYSTTDTRAAVLAPGYFATVADRLQPGNIIICQSADALAFLPVRSGGAVGNGLVLDASAAPIHLTAAAAQLFNLASSAMPVVRTLSLGTIAPGITVGREIPVSATVTGPVATVTFSLLDPSGAVVSTKLAAPIDGVASASFTATTVGNGYRIRAADTDEPAATMVSVSFVITEAYALLLQSGNGSLVTQGGAELAL